MLKYFAYKFNEGPLPSKEELLGDWGAGNCRRAVQYYIFNKKNIFLKPDEVLCPKAYNETGVFITGKNEEFSFDPLLDGDIVYAEKIRDKEERTVDKSPKAFATNDDYVTALHAAIFIGEKGKEIWHATAIEGSSCFWSLENFLHFYKPIVAKRI